MGIQSKLGGGTIKEFLRDILVGSKKKRIVSGTILLIIAYLLLFQSRGGDQVRLKLRKRARKEVTAAAIIRREAKATSTAFSCPRSWSCSRS
jgi:hypothetical protein